MQNCTSAKAGYPPTVHSHHVFTIAEIGANHEGSIDEAHRLIDSAARCGVDAVKFQTYRPEAIVARTEIERRSHFARLSLSQAQFGELAGHASQAGLVFLSTPFDDLSADFLDPLVPAFKVASGDLTAHTFLAHIARKGRPMILSTGMATLEEIKEAVAVIERFSPLGIRTPVTLLHCVTAYPTPDDQANLLSIPYLREETGRPVGYSDHTLGIHACLAAVALGATVIEKHFTADKSRTTLRDHQLSADERDMSDLILGVRRIETMLGERRKQTASAEAGNRTSMRRSLAAAVAIHKGDIISKDMLTVLRPGSGLPPGRIDQVVGQRAACDINPGELLTAESIEGAMACVR